MSLYEFSNSVNDFSNLVSTQEVSPSDLKDKTAGELFLSLGVPGGYLLAKKFASGAIKSVKARMSGASEAEEPVEAEAEEHQ